MDAGQLGCFWIFVGSRQASQASRRLINLSLCLIAHQRERLSRGTEALSRAHTLSLVVQTEALSVSSLPAVTKRVYHKL